MVLPPLAERLVLEPGETAERSRLLCQVAWATNAFPPPTIAEVRAAIRTARVMGQPEKARAFVLLNRRLFAEESRAVTRLFSPEPVEPVERAPEVLPL